MAAVPRTETIGSGSEPFGHAVVEVQCDGTVVARAETDEHNHVWLDGLEPDTEYRYRVEVDGRPWAGGELLDWSVEEATLVKAGGRYDNRFRTFPAVDANVPVAFAVLGDFGVGIVDGRLDGARQLLIAKALERAVDYRDVRLVLTTGDNIYLGHQDTAGTGNEDDEWYSSFYEPYRYVLNRVPFFPTVGNHDAGDSESSDDRDQLADNLFLEHRFRSEVETGSASLDPGLFYRFQVGSNLEFICIDTSIASGMDVEHYFDDPAHDRWVRETLEGEGGRWRIPFSHHPPFCAGPEHGNTTGMVERLVPVFEEAGVRLVLSGHEHNFQYAVVNGIHYVVSGAAGKLRRSRLVSSSRLTRGRWAAAGHFPARSRGRDRRGDRRSRRRVARTDRDPGPRRTAARRQAGDQLSGSSSGSCSSAPTGWPYSGHASLRHSQSCSGPPRASLAGCRRSGTLAVYSRRPLYRTMLLRLTATTRSSSANPRTHGCPGNSRAPGARPRAVGGGVPGRRAARRRHGGVGPNAQAQPRDGAAAVVHGARARRPPGGLVGAAPLVLQQSRYAALLVSMHGTALYERRKVDNEQTRAFLAGQRELQQRLISGYDEEQVRRNQRLIWTWDSLSLGLLLGWAPFEVNGIAVTAGSLDPWPFNASEVVLRCEGRRLTGRFDDEDAMRQALADAPWVDLELQLRAATSR